jgi:hypothetical protein
MVYIGQHVGLISETWTDKSNACLSLPQWSQRPSRLVDHYLHSAPQSTTLINSQPRHDSAHDIEPGLPSKTESECFISSLVEERETEIGNSLPNIDWSNWITDSAELDFTIPAADPDLPSMGFMENLWDNKEFQFGSDWPCLNIIPSPVLSQAELEPQRQQQLTSDNPVPYRRLDDVIIEEGKSNVNSNGQAYFSQTKSLVGLQQLPRSQLMVDFLSNDSQKDHNLAEGSRI